MEDIFAIFGKNPYMEPVFIMLAALVVGWIFQKMVAQHLRRMAKKTKWKGDDVIIEGIGQAPILWVLIIGMDIASYKLPFENGYGMLVRQGLLIIFVISVSIALSRISMLSIELYTRKQSGALQSTSMFNVLTKITIYTLAGLVIMQTLGISILPLLTALGVGGLAVALALQDTLSNLFAGLHIIATRKFHPGDFIEIDPDHAGVVEDISWRNTTLRTLANNLIIIPNAKVASAIVINYANPQNELSVLVPVGVAYSSDLKKVEEVTLEVAREILKSVEGAVPDYEPVIRYTQFADSSVNFKVILRAKNFVDQYKIVHEFMKALHVRYKQEEIEIPFPQTDVHLKNTK